MSTPERQADEASDTAQFGIYFIPTGDSRLYRAGSQVLGYDIRAGNEVPAYEFVRPDWTRQTAMYGFHTTLTDAIDIPAERLPDIEAETESLLACLHDGSDYSLRPVGLRSWNPELIVLEMTPTPALLMLHTLLTARLQPMGTGTEYTRTGLRPARQSDVRKLQKFHSLFILDSFNPHFTFLSAFQGNDSEREQVLLHISDAIAPLPDTIMVGSLALVYRSSLSERFRIHREFTIPTPDAG